jgi:hypothetical protein
MTQYINYLGVIILPWESRGSVVDEALCCKPGLRPDEVNEVFNLHIPSSRTSPSGSLNL